MSVILDNLIVGSFEESFKSTHEFTHVLNVASECNVVERVGRIYYKCAIEDDCASDDIRLIIPQCLDFIRKAHDGGGIVFVHCLEGKSRSVCIVLAYLVYVLDWSVNDALEHVRSKRDIDIYPLYFDQVMQMRDAIT